MEKKEPWYTDDGNVNQCNHCEKQFSQKTKIRTTIWLIKSTPEYVSKKKKRKNTNLGRYMNVNIHSSIIYNCQDMHTT